MKALIEKMNDKITEAQSLVDTAKAEERALTDEEATKFNELQTEVNAIKRTLEITEENDKMEKREIVEEPIETRELKDFEDYLRLRATNLVAGTTGAVIPKTIANKIMTKVYDISPILQASTKYNVKGTLELPYYDETTSKITVAYATEFTALTSNAGTFNKIELSGFLAGALVKVSNSLINNSQFDIVNFVVDEMAKAIARFCEKELLVGTSAKVTGLSTATNTLTAASATAITADEVIKLRDQVKDAYQGNAMWIMSPATRTALRLLKDGNDRYLLQDDITAPFGQTLLGKPVYVSDNMPDMAAGKDAIYYGDMSCVATKFSEDVNIQVLKERFADEHATGVVGWVEFDGKIADNAGIAVLTMKATA